MQVITGFLFTLRADSAFTQFTLDLKDFLASKPFAIDHVAGGPAPILSSTLHGWNITVVYADSVPAGDYSFSIFLVYEVD
jgi:hypothetical protein